MAKRTQTAKFVYDSRINIIDSVRKNSSALVTSGGIYDSIKNMSSTALLDSGYVADCIISVDKNSTVSIVKDDITEKNTVTLGTEDDTSTFFIPNGRNENGEPIFDHVTLDAGDIVTGIRHSTADTVTTADLAVLYDAEEHKIILRPTRVGFVETDEQGQPRGAFFQYIFARYQNKNDANNGYGPRTDKSTTADDYTIWWDLTDNLIKERLTNNWVVKRYSIPVALVRYEDKEITGFTKDFTVAGFLEKAVWINPGVTFNFPKGRDINETGTLICDAKTSGYDSEGEPTYQPTMKVLMYKPCDIKDEDAKRLLPALYVDNFGNEYLDEEVKEEETFTYYYDPVNLLNNSIQYIKLSKRCTDVNTLSLYKSVNGSAFSKIPVGTYAIADDAKTIILNEAITLSSTEDEKHGGLVIKAEFYETNENYIAYVTDNWEIKGPTNEYSFDNNLGYYVDINGDKIVCCRFSTISSGYVVQKNLRADEPLFIVAFNPRTCFTLADNDDIESIMALIGSATGETMDQVLTNIEELSADIDELSKSLRQLIEDTKTEVLENTDQNYVHNTGRENIAGVKTFTDGIVANISGTASSVDKTFGSVELLPMGIVVAHAEATSGVSGAAAPNMDTIFLNDIRTDGTLTIKCIADNASAADVAATPLRQNSTEYTIGNRFKVLIDEANQKYKVFEVIAGIGTDEDPNHEYSNADPIGVMKTQVRICSDRIKAPIFEGTATKAQWADLAEIYESDADYAPGTLIMFGGEKEITLANFGYAHGVISSKPAYLMNADAKGLPVAMIGKVPVRVFGPVEKFDRIYMNMFAPGTAIANGVGEPLGIALESNDFKGEKLVLCVVKLKI